VISAVLAGELRWFVEHGSCLDVLRTMPENSVDSIVCDPPYELGFMGRTWDSSGIAYNSATWHEALRVLKPGGHLLAFGGTRTAHRIACAIEDAGFEIRDSIASYTGEFATMAHIYGSGFPKSLNISKEIARISGPDSPDIERLKGWGTAIKPAFEPVIVAQKPYDIFKDIDECLSLLAAKIAGQDSKLGHQEQKAPDSAALNAEQRSVTPEGLSEATDMSPSELATTFNLNTVLSWKRIWSDVSSLGNMSTIRMVLSQTIDLKTLKSLLLKLMRLSTTKDQTPASEKLSIVCSVESHFRVASKSLSFIQELSALELAMSPDQGNSQVGAANHEPVIVARKPLAGTVAHNVLTYGTGGINIDACRVAHASPEDLAAHSAGVEAIKQRGGSMEGSWKNSSDLSGASDVSDAGRWPPNVLLTHGTSCKRVGTREIKANPTWDTPNRDTEPSSFTGEVVSDVQHQDSSVPVYECADGCPVKLMDGQEDGASRYFPQFEFDPALDDLTPFLYNPKASRAERDRGLEDFPEVAAHDITEREEGSAGSINPRSGKTASSRNIHPTVKPVAIMRWLCRLVTPPGGVVLDLFCGSGTTGVAATLEGFRFIGIELNNTEKEPFASIARARIAYVAGGDPRVADRPVKLTVIPTTNRQLSIYG
jgi:hypothetical protein